MPDVSKLPKWAQSHIEALEGELRRQVQHVAALEAELRAENDPDAEVQYCPGYQHTFKQRPLPDGSIVEFKVFDGTHNSHIRAHVQEDRYTGQKVLYINGDRGVIIKPSSGNAFEIYPTR